MNKLIKIAMSSLLHFEAKVFGFPKIEPKYLWVILNSRNINFKKSNLSLFEGWPTVQFLKRQYSTLYKSAKIVFVDNFKYHVKPFLHLIQL